MPLIDIKAFKAEIANQIKGIALGAASSKFNAAKKELLDEFEGNAVTLELDEGPRGSDLSSATNGYGNLFSLFGFDSSDKPTEKLRSLLVDKIQIDTLDTKITEDSEGLIKYLYNYTIPDEADLNGAAPMPAWSDNKNWPSAVENGIDNFTHYLFSKRNFSQSRSGPALQVKNELRHTRFKPVPYLTQIFGNFKNKLGPN